MVNSTLRLVGLNGFGAFGIADVSRYFSEGLFPRRFNWSPRHSRVVRRMIDKAYGEQRFIVCGFSDGASLAHLVAAESPNCVGCIAHSGMLWWFQPRNIPVLLLRTIGDRTPTYRKTEQALEFYKSYGVRAELRDVLPLRDGIKHQFDSGLGVMAEWTRRHFGADLPIDWRRVRDSVDAEPESDSE